MLGASTTEERGRCNRRNTTKKTQEQQDQMQTLAAEHLEERKNH
jgi:hypothetical protein